MALGDILPPRRLQASTLAEAFKPLGTFDCPGSVPWIAKLQTDAEAWDFESNQSTKAISSRCYHQYVVSCFIFRSPADHDAKSTTLRVLNLLAGHGEDDSDPTGSIHND